jgi:hypothetical protein
MSSKGVLPITFGAVTEKNVEQLKLLNRAIFPINYNERVYKDILAFTDVTQLAYHNDVLVGAIACRLEKSAQVRPGGWGRAVVGVGDKDTSALLEVECLVDD